MNYYCNNCDEDLREWIVLNNINPDTEVVRCPNCGTIVRGEE